MEDIGATDEMRIVDFIGVNFDIVEVEWPILEIFKGELFFEKFVESFVKSILDEVSDRVEVGDLIGNCFEQTPEHHNKNVLKLMELFNLIVFYNLKKYSESL